MEPSARGATRQRRRRRGKQLLALLVSQLRISGALIAVTRDPVLFSINGATNLQVWLLLVSSAVYTLISNAC